MKELARHLDKEIKKVNETDLKKMWTDRFIYIKTKGLEERHVNLSHEESKLVDFIRT